ncbi:MAG TPA: hypothetical protein VLJ59_11130 [Mycobacteriales bacterium]|nr:hypothetical protein [Mycobacteriales bacterium]
MRKVTSARAVAVLVTAVVAVAAGAALLGPDAQAALQPRDAGTILWIDADTGQVTATWTGPADAASPARSDGAGPGDAAGQAEPAARQAMMSRRHPAGSTTRGADPALREADAQTYRVWECDDPNPYWTVRNYPPLICLANAGDIAVHITDVYQVDSGDNTGSFTWVSPTGRTYVTYLNDRFITAVFSARITVTHVHIN